MLLSHTHSQVCTHTQSFILSKLLYMCRYMYVCMYTHKVKLFYLRIYNFLKLSLMRSHQAVWYFPFNFNSFFCSCSTEFLSYALIQAYIFMQLLKSESLLLSLIMKAISLCIQICYLQNALLK